MVTDTQTLTIGLSIVIPLSMLLYSNSRVSDLSKRVDELNAEMNRRFDRLENNLSDKIDNAFQHMELLLKLHEAEHHGSEKGGK